MQVILLKDVQGSGKKGDLVKVSDGYAKNFLIKRGLALPADAQSLSELKNKEESMKRKEELEIAEANKISDLLGEKTLKITAKAGQGKLFGAVTTKEVAEEIKKQFNVDVDRRKIGLNDIKSFGTFTAEIKMAHGIVSKLFITVSEA